MLNFLLKKDTFCMPNFSVFNLVDQHSIRNIFAARTDILLKWSYNIENNIIKRKLPASLYVGFQNLSKVTPVMPRYKKLVSTRTEIVAFGTPAHTKHYLSGIRYVEVPPASPLAQEWFVVAHHPNFSRALIAREICPESHENRIFEGVLLTDPKHVKRISQAIHQFVGHQAFLRTLS